MPDLSPERPRLPGVALACLAVGLVAVSGEALAGRRAPHAPAKTVSPVRVEPVPVKPAAKPSAERPVSWTAGEPEARACSRTRRKLWQDGEGWVVKAVRSCS